MDKQPSSVGAFAKLYRIEFDVKAADLMPGDDVGLHARAFEQLLININMSDENVFDECFNSSPSAFMSLDGGCKAVSDMTKDERAAWEEGGGLAAHKAATEAGGGCTVDMTKDDLALHSVRIKAKQTTRIAFNTHARNTVHRATENFDEEQRLLHCEVPSNDDADIPIARLLSLNTSTAFKMRQTGSNKGYV